MKRVILKISGEALAGKNGTGINAVYVKKIAAEIKALYEKVDELGIIVGAGNIWRGRDAVENDMNRSSADYMGMLGTILNSLALQNALESFGLKVRVMSSLNIPSVCEPYIYRKAMSHLNKKTIVIFGGGTGNPFFSTDSAAALRAAEIGADCILMAKNGVDGVYNDDPRKNPEATRYETLTYDEMLAKHLSVMDLTSATLCRENKIKIIVFDMNVEGNIAKVVDEPTIGTIITE